MCRIADHPFVSTGSPRRDGLTSTALLDLFLSGLRKMPVEGMNLERRKKLQLLLKTRRTERLTRRKKPRESTRKERDLRRRERRSMSSRIKTRAKIRRNRWNFCTILELDILASILID